MVNQLVLSYLVLSLFLPLQIFGQGVRNDAIKLQQAQDLWQAGYPKLNIPPLTLSYKDYLAGQKKGGSLIEQVKFFKKLDEKLLALNTSKLSKPQLLESSILAYEVQLNLRRIALLQSLPKNFQPDDLGIYHQPNGSQWYQYLIQHWTSLDWSPEEIMQYGREEITRIHQEMQLIKNGEQLVTLSTCQPKDIEDAFRQFEKSTALKLEQFFPDFPTLPPVGVRRGTNPNLAQVPGYYGNGNLSYNLFEEPFSLHQVGWLFLHEANPGHHFQLSYEATQPIPNYRNSLSYSGFREGWAAYVEDVAMELEMYQSPGQQLSQMEWDLIRSTRLVLDVGINYLGWTNEKALSEWKKYIQDQDSIGLREINRMRRWPAQVLTYKLGAKKMKVQRELLQRQQGEAFDIKSFHTTLLSQRSIPVQLIELLDYE